MRLHLQGLIAAPHTPMLEDGSVDLGRIPALVDWLVARSVDGLFVLGSTGEGLSLTSDERRQVAAAFLAAAARRVPVLVHIGHQSVREAKALAAHARSIGADAISAVVPAYFPLASIDVLVDVLAEISAGAPGLPFYYYHIPGLSRVAVDTPTLLERTAARVPDLAGIKYTSDALPEFQACVDALGDRLDMLFGTDEMLLSGLVAGAHGAVGSTYNFAAPLYRGILDAFSRGDLDEARRRQARSVELVRILVAHGGPPAIKATMGLCGFDCGPVRLPQSALDEPARELLRRDLDAIGFFEWARGSVK